MEQQMQTEIEAASLNIDLEVMRQKLRQAGATLTHESRLLRRHNFDFPDGRLQKRGGWVRIRSEGDKITMTYKQLNDRTLTGTQEVNLTVDSVEQAKAFVESLGLVVKSYQETRRESWKLDGTEIELDEWPWLRPFVEIEAVNEAKLQEVFTKLELDWQTAVFGSVEVAYQAEYDVSEEDVDNLPLMTFEEPVPDILARNRRTV
jgi:adenylate cyclase, class 2